MKGDLYVEGVENALGTMLDAPRVLARICNLGVQSVNLA